MFVRAEIRTSYDDPPDRTRIGAGLGTARTPLQRCIRKRHGPSTVRDNERMCGGHTNICVPFTLLSFPVQVLVVEPPSSNHTDRLKLAELLFDSMRLGSVCFANSASLSLMASGRVTGLCVEIGAGVTHSTPVFEGLVLKHAQQRLELGGQDITQALKNKLVGCGVMIEVKLRPNYNALDFPD